MDSALAPPSQIHVRLVLLFMVAAHIAFFATALVTVNSCMGFIVNIDKAGSGARDAISACTDLRNIQVRVHGQLASWQLVAPPLAAQLLPCSCLCKAGRLSCVVVPENTLPQASKVRAPCVLQYAAQEINNFSRAISYPDPTVTGQWVSSLLLDSTQ